jgi:hypothetical protein
LSEAFKGGENMQRVLAGMVQKLGPGKFVKVGFLEGGMAGWEGPRPLNGKKDTTRKANLVGHQVPAAMAAFWHEYGTKNMPARPFFRPMIERKSPTWGKLLLAALKLSKYDTTKALMIAGLKMGEQLQESILQLKGPALAQSTIDTKGFPNLLIDSHNMIRSIAFQVEGDEQNKVNEGI